MDDETRRRLAAEEHEDGHAPPVDVRALSLEVLAVIALARGPTAQAAAEELARRGYRAERQKLF
jgi:hypothetical protein